MEQLHEFIAKALVLKAGRLSGAEVRYLRKWLGWSGRDFARSFDLSVEHVSRVENGHHPVSGVADRLLRVLVFSRVASPASALEDVLDLGDSDEAFELGVSASGRKWRAVA